MVLSVDKNVRVQAALIQIEGRVGGGELGSTPLCRPVLSTVTGNLCEPRGTTTDRILLVITMEAPFALELIDKNRQRVVHRGTTYPAPFIIKRDPGFDGEIQLLMKASQSAPSNGDSRSNCGPFHLASHVRSTPCFMPEWISTARTSRMEVLAHGQGQGSSGEFAISGDFGPMRASP